MQETDLIRRMHSGNVTMNNRTDFVSQVRSGGKEEQKPEQEQEQEHERENEEEKRITFLARNIVNTQNGAFESAFFAKDPKQKGIRRVYACVCLCECLCVGM